MAFDHIRSMSPTHWGLMAACLGGIGVQLSGMHTWTEVFSPQSVGGALVILGTQLAAIFTPKPIKSQD